MAAIDAEHYLEHIPEHLADRLERTAEIAKTAENSLYSAVPSAHCDFFGSVDPPAADDDVAVVEHDRLAGRDRELRLVEDDLGAPVVRAARTVAGAA